LKKCAEICFKVAWFIENNTWETMEIDVKELDSMRAYK
jgi:hypothetical protein